MVLVPENTLEGLQQRQQILTPPVTQILKKLDRKMTDILSSKQLDDEENAKLYNQVLQRYLTYYDQRKGQPLHVKLTTPKPVETPKQEEESKETIKESTEVETTPSAVEQEVMKSVPNRVQSRYLTLSLRSLVRYRVEHSKINFISPRAPLYLFNKTRLNLIARCLY